MRTFVSAFFEELGKLAEAYNPGRWSQTWSIPIKGTEQLEPNEPPPPKRRDLKRHLKLIKKGSSFR